mmetsp:Transcript_63555/g.113091  ORF Transcript_63555/g.113091 Transcript_63555/m.113091 type:complete len:328 (-) Transcript_63555:122-1105(-)|eukprot:CAMPEP_0197627834 /NCGR_PEP_ID=MMETSP1338-20131121/6337_1 /TAXON_ID=43686 ORGANISM="Pelagodinium beii, Strain RCC1491" /NCGR_SAMPLE_ID=MMETSP1338 /ASSEMBLY_ACC=CAM_ASM_000754 /LENGTH=327 /DNA_ID=CAMNT_0043198661 /DNA_START=49 /DNA_END=1032 /DNA_ORIENTATION=-
MLTVLLELLLLIAASGDLIESPLQEDDICLDGSCEMKLLQQGAAKKTLELSNLSTGEAHVAEEAAPTGTSLGERANETQKDGFAPILEASTEAVPQQAPVKLALFGKAQDAGVGPITKGVTGLHVRRNIFTMTGHDLTLANGGGKYVYATEGNFFTLHSRTHLYDARTGQGLVEISSPVFSIHRIYELESYIPICPQQKASETIDGKPTYPLARLTKHLMTMYNSYKVEAYRCDGSLAHQWEIKDRNWFSIKKHMNIWESGSDPVGTMDQSHFFQWTANYDAFITAGEDLTLFAATAVVMDMSMLKDQKNAEAAASSSSSSDSRRRR